MTPSSLQRRVRRLECETFGSFCPCGYTNQWAGLWAQILTAIEQRGDGTPVGPSRCVRCGGLVPRPPAAEVLLLYRTINALRLEDAQKAESR